MRLVAIIPMFSSRMAAGTEKRPTINIATTRPKYRKIRDHYFVRNSEVVVAEDVNL
jgi:hypothetical protein